MKNIKLIRFCEIPPDFNLHIRTKLVNASFKYLLSPNPYFSLQRPKPKNKAKRVKLKF